MAQSGISMFFFLLMCGRAPIASVAYWHMFSGIDFAPPTEVDALTEKYNEDSFQEKVNLGVEAYRTDDDKPWVLPVVRIVEAQIANDDTLNHEYLPVSGLPAFTARATELLLGTNNPAIIENRVLATQACGGTGAIKLAAEFMHRHLGVDVVYVSKPTWANHKEIFRDAGFSQIREYRYLKADTRSLDIDGMLEDLRAHGPLVLLANHKEIFRDAGFSQIREYRYLKADTRSLDIDGMLEDLRKAPEKACVILQGCAHNPTGVDPTKRQWMEIADVCEERKLTILIDIAYQGFATGDLEADAEAVRYMERRGFEMFIAQSFSKNFGLYNERVGNLVTITNTSDTVSKVKSQMELIVRTMWSNPPNHGARIVSTILSTPALSAEWKENVKAMAQRIVEMRRTLYEKCRTLGIPGTWDHIKNQRGMFSYTGLTEAQVNMLQTKHHIYMLKSGRINMCGLTSSNIDYVVDAISSVVRN